MARPVLSRADVEAGGQVIDDNVLGLLRLIHDDILVLHGKQESTDVALSAHVAREEMQLDAFMQAFPDGPVKHREAHEAMIAAAHAQERFWTELRLDVAKKGVWGVMIIVCGLVMAGVAAKLGVVMKP